ncbi:hypothetical protein H4R33_003100 [Dimargaris cristalligena]|nr:hypothetical protein H4R33_003100 [Dimargaris cristalligena]
MDQDYRQWESHGVYSNPDVKVLRHPNTGRDYIWNRSRSYLLPLDLQRLDESYYVGPTHRRRLVNPLPDYQRVQSRLPTRLHTPMHLVELGGEQLPAGQVYVLDQPWSTYAVSGGAAPFHHLSSSGMLGGLGCATPSSSLSAAIRDLPLITWGSSANHHHQPSLAPHSRHPHHRSYPESIRHRPYPTPTRSRRSSFSNNHNYSSPPHERESRDYSSEDRQRPSWGEFGSNGDGGHDHHSFGPTHGSRKSPRNHHPHFVPSDRSSFHPNRNSGPGPDWGSSGYRGAWNDLPLSRSQSQRENQREREAARPQSSHAHAHDRNHNRWDDDDDRDRDQGRDRDRDGDRNRDDSAYYPNRRDNNSWGHNAQQQSRSMGDGSFQFPTNQPYPSPAAEWFGTADQYAGDNKNGWHPSDDRPAPNDRPQRASSPSRRGGFTAWGGDGGNQVSGTEAMQSDDVSMAGVSDDDSTPWNSGPTGGEVFEFNDVEMEDAGAARNVVPS